MSTPSMSKISPSVFGNSSKISCRTINMPSMRDANSDAIPQHLPCKVTNKLAHRQGKGKRDDSEWRVASGEWNEGKKCGLKVAPFRRSNKLPAQVAISHDEDEDEGNLDKIRRCGD
jgi:hypothetical protein